MRSKSCEAEAGSGGAEVYVCICEVKELSVSELTGREAAHRRKSLLHAAAKQV